ncbi:branched-chain amino acid ABC transporter substrate-binding protein [Nocardia aurantia]|uniref:Leucine-, isoleucine-, valine-, threonine-, and alanine-binding protein n=1 Tax=Nocardia aurantia TaxID=2585199 RepID=A0A7K0DVJ1_9NOCA|nr:branched-chain amino acid ABC transporter substrate-binding protein [Nocardia aurantia]MQY29803.1 Leucine-, isoleucine-, valine-, threonine-, and alanine-binding protein [Nocardia aurantia]
MHTRNVARVGVPLLAVCLALAACGSRDEHGAGDSGGGTVLKIGFDAPLTGDLSAVGLGLQHSAQLAVDKANKDGLVPGVKFQLVAKDDQAQASIGQQNAAAFAADSAVVGVVASYNSSVAQSMIPTLDSADLVQVSPANTNPSLTQGANYTTAKARPHKNYFRTIPTDALEAPAVAIYTHDTLKLTKVAVVDDGKVYGQGVVQNFTDKFTALGGQIVTKQQVSDAAVDYSAVVNDIKNSGAQAVLFGGEYPQAGPLSKQLKAAGVNIPLLGCDAVYDEQYIKLAGPAAEGDDVVTAGAPIGKTAEQQGFIDAYKAAGFAEPYGIFGPYSYDATTAILQGVKAATAANGGKVPGRAAIEAAVQQVNFPGLTGTVAFDQYGDTTNRTMVMNTVKDGKWTTVGTVAQ